MAAAGELPGPTWGPVSALLPLPKRQALGSWRSYLPPPSSSSRKFSPSQLACPKVFHLCQANGEANRPCLIAASSSSRVPRMLPASFLPLLEVAGNSMALVVYTVVTESHKFLLRTSFGPSVGLSGG